MLRRSNAVSLLALLSCALPALATAGTLDQIRKSGEIRIGYRTDAPPLAFSDSTGQAAGYSVDLCKRIATAVKDELKLADLKVTFVPLTSADRLDAIVNNKADIECGATTVTLSRAAKVDFTLMTFVTEEACFRSPPRASMRFRMRPANRWPSSPARRRRRRSSNAITKNLIDAKVVSVASREEAMKQLDAGQVAAFASDQIVLIGQIMKAADPKKYSLARELFSFEPYAFVVRRDDSEFRLVANRAIAQVYRTGQIEQLYGRWFGQAGIKPSPVLTAMYALQALPE